MNCDFFYVFKTKEKYKKKKAFSFSVYSMCILFRVYFISFVVYVCHYEADIAQW